MERMVVFECGQKRQRLAHFQDDPVELVGRDCLAPVLPNPPAGKFRFRFRRIASPRPDSNGVRNMAY